MQTFFKHPLVTIAVAPGITGFFSTQLGKLEITSSLRIYLPQEHESYRRLFDMEDRFASTETVGIVFESPKDGILPASSINLIRNLTNEIENDNWIEFLKFFRQVFNRLKVMNSICVWRNLPYVIIYNFFLRKCAVTYFCGSGVQLYILEKTFC